MKRIFAIIAALFLTNCAFADLKYIEIESIKNAPTVQVESIEDFEAIITKNKVSTAYLHKPTDTLLVIAENTYFSFILNGYFTLKDYKTGNSLLYNNGTDYNEAKELTLNDNSAIFYFYKRNDFKSVSDCRDAYKNGFCFDSKTKTTESDIYYKAKEAGYKNISEYNEYLDFKAKEFKSKKDMQTAKNQGFPVPEEFLAENGTLKNSNPLYLMKIGSAGADFYNSQENGFPNYAEYTAAREKEISTYADLQKYREITNFCDKLSKSKKIDKGFALIYHQIQQMQKSEMSLSVLSNTLKDDFSKNSMELRKALNFYANDVKNQGEYDKKQRDRYSRNQTIDIANLFSEGNLKKFFKEVNISQIGSYNENTEIFRRK
ncbi:MAG: hypothetical protein J6N81_07050 [Treponema sp.]|nr:hypothetical protein [Treponema sp.]